MWLRSSVNCDLSRTKGLEGLRIRHSGVADRAGFRSLVRCWRGHLRGRREHFRSRVGRDGVDQFHRPIRTRQTLRKVEVFHREEHVVSELCLVGATAADTDTAALTAGHGSAVRQGHSRVAAVPTDHHRVRGGAVLEAAGRQRGLFIAGIEPTSENRPIGCRICDPRREP